MKKIFKWGGDLLSDVLLVILSADILYLYFAGGWYEPNLIILTAELIALFTIAIWGIFRFYTLITKEPRHKRKL